MVGGSVYCNGICGLIKELQLHHAPEEWRFFIDSYKVSLTAILLHNGNKHTFDECKTLHT
jgi:hypothetical protein